jgi:hypothetical protein
MKGHTRRKIIPPILVESDNNLVTGEHNTAVTFRSCFSSTESTKYLDMEIGLKPNELSVFLQ